MMLVVIVQNVFHRQIKIDEKKTLNLKNPFLWNHNNNNNIGSDNNVKNKNTVNYNY